MPLSSAPSPDLPKNNGIRPNNNDNHDSSTVATLDGSLTEEGNSMGDVSSCYPDVYLHHYNGGAFGPSNFFGNPTLGPGTNPARLRILPLRDASTQQSATTSNYNDSQKLSETGVSIVKLAPPGILSRSEFIHMLISIANNHNDGGSSSSNNNNNNNNKDQSENAQNNDDNGNIDFTRIFPTRRVAIQEIVTQQQEQQQSPPRYLSCRRMAPNGGALAEYRTYIGEFEQFYLEHNVAKGTFSFRSHNNLYLHYNKTLGTVAFKPKEMSWATWMVHPLGLASGTDDDRYNDLNGQHIVFVGVVENGETLVVQRTAEGVGPDWKTDFDTIIQTIVQDVPVGCCSIFQHPFTKHQWCIAKYDDAQTIGIVVVSEKFPQSLAVECHDDLTMWYMNSSTRKNPKRLERIQRMGLDEERIAGKELAGLMAEYDEQYYASIRSTKLTQLEQDLASLQQKMEQNIQELHNNIDDIEKLSSKADDLLELSKVFKKQAEKLPKGNEWKHTTVVVAAGLGAGAGALAGWLLGGPGGALVLASEGLEIATGAATVAFLGGVIGSNSVVSFWSRKFVKFVFRASATKAAAITAAPNVIV